MCSKDSDPGEQMLMTGAKVEGKNRLRKGNDYTNNGRNIPQLQKDMIQKMVQVSGIDGGKIKVNN